MPTAKPQPTLPAADLEPPSVTPRPGAGDAPLPLQVSSGKDDDTGTAAVRWLVYAFRHRVTNRHYVGVTSRCMADRISGHVSQSRRARRIRPGGLAALLRMCGVTRKTFHDHFAVRSLGLATTENEARTMEVDWMARLGARSPGGLNLMPGGASLGGPSNAIPVVVRIDGKRTPYPSIGRALLACNQEAAARGEATLEPSTIYARMATGWGIAAALGQQPHQDGRGLRDGFALGGMAYSCLRQAGDASGTGTGALRSRLHRARQASEPGTLIEVGQDRRKQSRGRQPELGLRHPVTAAPVTVREYAAATGLPASTVLHRAHRLGVDASPAAMATPLDRRQVVTLVRSDGVVVVGGYRELVRRVLDPAWPQPPRSRRLSASGVRARLRRLTVPERSNVQFVRWACGQIAGDPSYDDVLAMERRGLWSRRGGQGRQADRAAAFHRRGKLGTGPCVAAQRQ